MRQAQRCLRELCLPAELLIRTRSSEGETRTNNSSRLCRMATNQGWRVGSRPLMPRGRNSSRLLLAQPPAPSPHAVTPGLWFKFISGLSALPAPPQWLATEQDQGGWM
ncbi:hypothetical protein PAL_GLEAN10017443 [Pteropus alecto]|uniref:Uncharacterized protein n=1 Tax=Pteropus alecto TaxID=9402 RepID=L5K2N5_PTEAL|nr:hypothetical protein PAL_GLEAN10017443 [Pteropus alecto]